MLPCPRCQYDLIQTEAGRCPECGSPFDRKLLVEARPGAWPPGSAKRAVIGAGILILPFAWLSMSARIPLWWSPFPLLFIIPASWFQSFGAGLVLGCLLLLSAFLIFAKPLAKGTPNIPRRSIMAVGALQGLNALWLFYRFSYGVKYQGTSHVLAILLINAAVLVTLAALWYACAKRPAFVLSLAFHWVAWVWASVYLFPYLGELP